MEPKSNALKLIEFIEERKPFKWTEENLALYPTDHPTVTMHKDQVKKFRNKYVFLINFVALALGKDPEKLCSLDMVEFLWKAGAKDEEVVKQFELAIKTEIF